MYSGKDVYRDFCNRLDFSYSEFVDKLKLKKIFDRALSVIFEKKWANLKSQKEYDELRYSISTENVINVTDGKVSTSPLFIKNVTNSGNVVSVTTIGKHGLSPLDLVTTSGILGMVSVPSINGSIQITGIPTKDRFEFIVTSVAGTYTPNTGSIIHDKLLTDYLHLFALKAKYEQVLNLKIVKSVNATPPYIEFSKRTNLRDTEQVLISNYNDQNVNGVRYVQYLTDFRYRLYADENLTIPVTGVLGNSQTGGVIKRIIYNYATPLNSDQKISSFGQGTVESPVYETADNEIKLSPPNCKQVTIDYLSTPKVQIDLDDDITDLTLIWPFSFIDLWINEAVILYSSPARDQQLEQSTLREMQ